MRFINQYCFIWCTFVKIQRIFISIYIFTSWKIRIWTDISLFNIIFHPTYFDVNKIVLMWYQRINRFSFPSSNAYFFYGNSFFFKKKLVQHSHYYWNSIHPESLVHNYYYVVYYHSLLFLLLLGLIHMELHNPVIYTTKKCFIFLIMQNITIRNIWQIYINVMMQ